MIYNIFDKRMIDYNFFDGLLMSLIVIGGMIFAIFLFVVICNLIDKIKNGRNRK